MAVLSMRVFLCGGGFHKREEKKKKKSSVRLGGKRPMEKLESSISSKALLMIKMISWRKVKHDDVEDDQLVDWEEENALWKRTIIKGEKCRPLEFSGKISYDANGNLVLD